jgi:hypothetical protein
MLYASNGPLDAGDNFPSLIWYQLLTESAESATQSKTIRDRQNLSAIICKSLMLSNWCAIQGSNL